LEIFQQAQELPVCRFRYARWSRGDDVWLALPRKAEQARSWSLFASCVNSRRNSCLTRMTRTASLFSVDCDKASLV